MFYCNVCSYEPQAQQFISFWDFPWVTILVVKATGLFLPSGDLQGKDWELEDSGAWGRKGGGYSGPRTFVSSEVWRELGCEEVRCLPRVWRLEKLGVGNSATRKVGSREHEKQETQRRFLSIFVTQSPNNLSNDNS